MAGVLALAWKRLQRPTRLAQPPDQDALERARGLLSDFGSLWRDAAVPDELREEAAREIFERLDLWGPDLVAVHPRAEHAWLLAIAAQKSEGLVLVGREDTTRPIPTQHRTAANRRAHSVSVMLFALHLLRRRLTYSVAACQLSSPAEMTTAAPGSVDRRAKSLE